MRIGNHGKAADIRNIVRCAPDSSAKALVFQRRRIDIIHRDIAGPVGRQLTFEFWREGHHAADAGAVLSLADLEDIIGRHARHAHFGCLPADDIAIEKAGRGRVAGHQLTPNELAVSFTARMGQPGHLALYSTVRHALLLRGFPPGSTFRASNGA